MDMKKIAYYQNLHLNQLNHLKKELKLRKHLESSIGLRAKWINNQNKMAYRQEVENIRTMLNSGLADATTIEQLKKREDDMKKLLSS